MRMPRDLTGRDLAQAMARLGYAVTRQSGSHLRLTCPSPQEHHITIPDHDPIKLGTLNAILREVAAAHGFTRDELLGRLFP